VDKATGRLLHDYTIVLSRWITLTPVTQVTTTVKTDRQGIAVTANFAALWTAGCSADSMVGDRRHLSTYRDSGEVTSLPKV